MPDAIRLDILRTIREEAGLNQSEMARLCGLQGRLSHQTAGAWERGTMTPQASRRGRFLHYLWDGLRLRRDPARFADIWEILVEEWAWEPISEEEWRSFTHVARPVSTPADPAPAALVAPFQAPLVTPHFVGRQGVAAQATVHLLSPMSSTASRLVAFVGMGGVGKTTLAAQVAHQVQAQFRDGVLWGQTAISAPLDILNSWARAFGYDYSGLRDVESCAAALRSALADKQLFFVLDDVTSVAQVRPLFVGGKAAAFLLTTRSEDVATALNSQILHLTELAPAEGVQLLVSLLGAARVAAEEAAARQIGEFVHHLPLAVEIVGQLLAARPRRSLAQMAERLHDVQYRLDLQISDRDVRTSFLVSWEALDAPHQRLFAHLALFGGRSFTAAAVAAVLAAAEADLVEQLDLLVARSLLTAVADDRYRQHPLLADFAQEQLGDAQGAWARFAECQLAFTKRHQSDYAALEPEWENLMAGMAAAHRLQAWQLVLDYAETLTEPWFTQARYTQARQGYGWAVAAATAQQNNAIRVHYQIQLAYIACELSDFEAATPQLQEALQLAEQERLHRLKAEAQYHLARIALEQCAYEDTDSLLTDCEQIRVQLGDTPGLAKICYLRGILLLRTGTYALAQQMGQQALRIQETENDIPGILGTLSLLTDCALATANYELSEQYCQRSLKMLEKQYRKAELAEVYFGLAMTYRYTEQTQRAWDCIAHSHELAEHMGNRLFLAYICYEQSRIKLQMGEAEQALQLGLASLALMSELNDNYNRVICLRYLGDLYRDQGNHDQAFQLWTEGEQIALNLRHPEIQSLRQRLAAGLIIASAA